MQYQESKISLWEDLESFRIPMTEINLATRHLSPKTRLLDDKNCKIYLGKLSERWHRLAAIKCQDWRGSEAINEFLLLSRCSHENIIRFIGFCDADNQKIIVSDYAINRSLDCHLYDVHKRRDLTWANRLKICLGAAKGLQYLQSCLGEDTMVIHRNVQSKYILLDENMEAKICGLNFSRVVSRKHQQTDSPVRYSNKYYLDPVYQESCILKPECVVYSFGVVLFEVICGRLANGERSMGDVKPQGLIKLVRQDYDAGLDNLIDSHIRDQIDRRSFYLMKETAYKCISLNIKDRPTMDMIVKTIEEALDAHNHGADSIITTRSLQHQNTKDFKIPLSDLKLATRNFNWPIHRGSTKFGSTYKAQLPYRTQNRKVAIKRYDQELGHRDEFLNELDMMCSLHHENIIPFIGYCEEDGEMILASEYATNDSLYNRLMSDGTIHCITWVQRLKICLGAAKGLKYLHSGLGDRGRVIHRTFSSKRILLDDNMEAKISGFVYSVLLPRNQQQVYQAMGDWPYKDPVYHETDILTTEVDIYSFGMVMFELLIGEVFFPPTWCEKRLPYTLMNKVRNNYHAEPYKLVDPAIRGQVDIQSLLAFIEVASKCISFNLKDRPSMNRIVKTIEKLLHFQDNGFASASNIQIPECEKIEDFKISLGVIKMVTENFSTGAQIGDGGFGIVYKGKLSEHWQNRTAAIKRLSRGNQARNDEFHKELQLIFNFHHENIIPFIGYCDEENEMIIVTEYAANGSLDSHLEDLEKRRRLTWEQRLKICLGAAKGLKHLHSGHGEYNKVIHRDVKSANILLDENMEAKICDFGLSRSRPTSEATDTGFYTSIGGTECYIDPIYRESGKLRIASDVYSFGVVLFEILSGKLSYNPIIVEDANPQLLINLVRRYKTGILDKLMDPCIKDETDDHSFYTFQDIAYECISLNYKKRPTMDTIIDRIEEALEYQSQTTRLMSTNHQVLLQREKKLRRRKRVTPDEDSTLGTTSAKNQVLLRRRIYSGVLTTQESKSFLE